MPENGQWRKHLYRIYSNNRPGGAAIYESLKFVIFYKM